VDIVFLIFDRITALDAVGPYEVLSRLPGARVTFCSPNGPGTVRTDNEFLGLVADQNMASVTAAEILVVPGGFGTRALMADRAVLDWVCSVDASSRWTTSVCTGSLILGAAGLLNGRPATTHWTAMDTLAGTGAHPTRQRVVRSDKYVTAAGVSAGIDMALLLAAWDAGDDVAQAVQLAIEYDPQPPFDAGSPDKAPPEIVARVRGQ
jgi:putative intracellular protease/amidase